MSFLLLSVMVADMQLPVQGVAVPVCFQAWILRPKWHLRQPSAPALPLLLAQTQFCAQTNDSGSLTHTSTPTATTTTCAATPACFAYNSESTTSISTAISVPPHFLFILSYSLIGRTCRKRCSATVHNAGAPPHTASRSTQPPCGGRHLSCPPSRHHIAIPKPPLGRHQAPKQPSYPCGPPLSASSPSVANRHRAPVKCSPAAVSTDACL